MRRLLHCGRGICDGELFPPTIYQNISNHDHVSVLFGHLPESLLVLVPIGVVETEGLVDRGALVHELDRSPRVGGDVADGQ